METMETMGTLQPLHQQPVYLSWRLRPNPGVTLRRHRRGRGGGGGGATTPISTPTPNQAQGAHECRVVMPTFNMIPLYDWTKNYPVAQEIFVVVIFSRILPGGRMLLIKRTTVRFTRHQGNAKVGRHPGLAAFSAGVAYI